MTVKQLTETLRDYPDDAHVVVAVMPNDLITVRTDGKKLDINDAWCDGTGVINIICTDETCKVDASLRAENQLELGGRST